MRKKHVCGLRKLSVMVLSFAMVLSLLIPCGRTEAKAPAMAKKKVSVNVGKTVTIKLKNASKKAKVTWKSKSKKIAKIAKKSKTSAKVRGVKEGSTKVTAKYVLGKTKKTLSCKVIVNGVDNTLPQSTPTQPAVNVTPTPAQTATATPEPIQPTAAPTEVPYSWVTTWGTAEENFNASPNSMPQTLDGTTVRQIVRVTTSGKQMKLRLSNQYGKSDVVIHSMHLAKQVEADKSTIDTSTDTVVKAYGSEEMVIPAGEILETDPVDFSVEALENVAVTMYFGSTPTTTSEMTGHRGARATTYQVSGNEVSTETFSSPTTTTAWYFLADISLMSPEGSKAVVCFGDSITDGYGTDADYLGRKPDSYTRWADYFAKRLQANEGTKHISVINEGIGANSILGSYPTDAGKDRFKRDLLEHDGVGYCIILFGVNDLNALSDTSKYDQLLPEYQKMVALCHENGIKVYGAPILPFGTSSYYSEASEQVRTMINEWMRSSDSQMDGIIDFESAVADPANPKNVLEKYTHSDGLHPYDGYDVMADAIDLKMFE
ncbi:MAG: GDSL-type esterase/lipase family protein [Lachnospiraceae bacterium]